MNAIQFPLTRITIGFVLGILFAYYCPIKAPTAFSLLFLSASIVVFSYIQSKKQLQPHLFFGIASYCLSFCIGISTLIIHSGWNQKNNYIHQIHSSEKQHVLEVILREKLKSTPYYNRYIAVVNRIDLKNSSGKIIVNFNKNQFEKDFRIGTRLQINSNVIQPSRPLNPDQFDYGKYLKNKSILAQTYVDFASVKTNGILVKDAVYYADLLRNRILNNLKKSHFHETELNVLAALILGQQQDIAPEIVHDYQWAGAIHILSVSGLHVGFIVLFLNFLLNFLPKKKWTSYLKLIIILFSLWGFAVLAGFSPSVIRSVAMFSFVAIGMHLKRKTNIFHTLLVSLLLILLFEPSFLFDIGFQLSYIALFFILWTQPLLRNIWQPENKIICYFWEILTVSFAAQIGTLPLSIYYFHQFPGLFFITNLIVIPFLSIIMALGVLVMVLAALNSVPQILSAALEWCLFILNKIIGWIASFESFIIQDISFNNVMLLSAYLIIISVVLCCARKSFSRMVFVLLAILLFQTSYFSSCWKAKHQKEWIVFNTKKSTVIAERNGENVTVFTNVGIEKKSVLNPYLVANFSRISKVKPIENLAYFQSHTIVIIDSLGNYPRNVQPDIMVLRQSPRLNLERVFQTCKPKLLVVDASNYKSDVLLWKSTCLKQRIPFHNTNEKGFFKLQN